MSKILEAADYKETKGLTVRSVICDSPRQYREIKQCKCYSSAVWPKTCFLILLASASSSANGAVGHKAD
jgi:hypothetical protein